MLGDFFVDHSTQDAIGQRLTAFCEKIVAYDLGVATGKMAVKILTGEANVSEMPIEYAPQFTKKYNKTICDALEITVPDDYVAIEE